MRLDEDVSSGESGNPCPLGDMGHTAYRGEVVESVSEQDSEASMKELWWTVEGRVALAEKLLRVRTKLDGLQPLRANAAQCAFEAAHRQESIVLKARQMGLSTWVAGRFFLRAMVTPGTVTVHVAHTREAATAMFRMVQRMWANLPDPLREGAAKLSKNNASEMVFAGNDSEIRVVSAAEPNAGRGLTVHALHCSELSR